MNMISDSAEDQISNLFRAIGPSTRLSILLAIGKGEACVCHLEAQLGLRQAYISQHLMALREAGLLSSRRDGRYVYYRLDDERLLVLIQTAAAIADIPEMELEKLIQDEPLPHCECPGCSTIIHPESLQVQGK
jgi:DNA-binding transcriptional ArsR family regulator